MRVLLEKIRPNAIVVVVAFVWLQLVALRTFINLFDRVDVDNAIKVAETLQLGVVLVVLVTSIVGLLTLASQLATDPEPDRVLEYKKLDNELKIARLRLESD